MKMRASTMEMRHYSQEGWFRWDPQRRYLHNYLGKPNGLWLCPGAEWNDYLFIHGDGVPLELEEWRFEVKTERVLWIDTLDAVDRFQSEFRPERDGWSPLCARYAGVFIDPDVDLKVGASPWYVRKWGVPSLCLWNLGEVVGTPRLVGPSPDYDGELLAGINQ